MMQAKIFRKNPEGLFILLPLDFMYTHIDRLSGRCLIILEVLRQGQLLFLRLCLLYSDYGWHGFSAGDTINRTLKIKDGRLCRIR